MRSLEPPDPAQGTPRRGVPASAPRGARTWQWLLVAFSLSAATGVMVAGHDTTKPADDSHPRRVTALPAPPAALRSQPLALKPHAARVPSDVTRMARAYERLMQETAELHYHLGVLLARNRQYPQAVAEFQKVVELRPKEGDAYYNLGVLYAEHLPDRERAMANFRRYLQLKPRADDAAWVKQYIASWQAREETERPEASP